MEKKINPAFRKFKRDIYIRDCARKLGWFIVGTAGVFIVYSSASEVYKNLSINNEKLESPIQENESNHNKESVVEDTKAYYEDLKFSIQRWSEDGKYYLFIEDESLLKLIKIAMEEIDVEYSSVGATPVFYTNDQVFSHFTPEHILGLMHTETTFRCMEIASSDSKIFDVSNYKRYQGVDKKGVIYNGLGMMNETTVDYVKNLRVNTFGLPSYVKCGDKQVEVNFENLNIYDYVINSQAKTEQEIKKAISEAIILNVKTTYEYLNACVKNYVKLGKHDENFNDFANYSQFRTLDDNQIIMYFAFLAYNQGPNETINSAKANTLFAKDANGDYINNHKYPQRISDYYKKWIESHNIRKDVYYNIDNYLIN